MLDMALKKTSEGKSYQTCERRKKTICSNKNFSVKTEFYYYVHILVNVPVISWNFFMYAHKIKLFVGGKKYYK